MHLGSAALFDIIVFLNPVPGTLLPDLVQMMGWISTLQLIDNESVIRIRCVRSERHLKHAEQGGSRTRVEKLGTKPRCFP